MSESRSGGIAMGVDVVLMNVSRAGTSPRRRKVTPAGVTLTDSSDVLVRFVDRARGAGKTPTLERVAPYGDLILTPVEMPQLLEELARVRGLATTDAERDVLTRLERMATRCRDDAATELWFQGD